MLTKVYENLWQTSTTKDTEITLVQRFEQQVEQYPFNIAFKENNKTISYEELNQLANGIAAVLIQTKKRGEKHIALLFSSKSTMAAAIIGVLKAGLSWVPLDIAHPLSRTSYVINDCGISTILTDTNSLSVANQFVTSPIDIQTLVPMKENLGLSIDPKNISHILYTSGSTGQSKGVIHTHRNILEYARCYTNMLRISNKDKHTLISSLTHSGGITTLFRTLLNGATLLPYDIKQQGLANLPKWIQCVNATIYHSVPTVFRNFLKDCDEVFSQVRMIQLGGEPISTRDIDLYRKHFSEDCILVNILGATELSAYRHFFVTKKTSFSGNIVPAGYQVGDKEMLLLDENRQPVSYGEIGEIVIRSDYLAEGYWNKKEMTEKAFSYMDKKRVYHTGDVGYLTENKCLICLGRKDSQVKIRGCRVELLEIELELLKHSDIEDAAVIVEEKIPEKIIVAFIVPKKTTPSYYELYQFLHEKLPNYMIPSNFIPVDSLPLNVQKKIDRPALKQIHASYHQQKDFVSPRNFQENVICDAFKKTLGLEKVSIHDNFFELGGHSLLIYTVFEHIAKHIMIKLPMITIFENSTVEKLAIAFEKGHQEVGHVVAIRSEGKRPPLICMHSIEGNGLNYHCLAQTLGKNQPVYVINAPQKENQFIAYSSLEEQVEHYISLLRQKVPRQEYFLVGHSAGGYLAYEAARQLTKMNITVSFLGLFDTVLRYKNKKYWLHWQNQWHFLYCLPAWLYFLLKDKNKYKRIANIFGAHLPIKTEPTWFDILPQDTREYIVKNQNLITKYLQQKKSYSGKMHLFRVHCPNNNPKKRLAIDYGWVTYASTEIDTYYVEGGHRDMMYKENISSLSKALQEAIDKIL